MSLADFAGIAALYTFGPLIVPAAWAFAAWAFIAEYRSLKERHDLRARIDAEEKR